MSFSRRATIIAELPVIFIILFFIAGGVIIMTRGGIDRTTEASKKLIACDGIVGTMTGGGSGSCVPKPGDGSNPCVSGTQSIGTGPWCPDNNVCCIGMGTNGQVDPSLVRIEPCTGANCRSCDAQCQLSNNKFFCDAIVLQTVSCDVYARQRATAVYNNPADSGHTACRNNQPRCMQAFKEECVSKRSQNARYTRCIGNSAYPKASAPAGKTVCVWDTAAGAEGICYLPQ